MTRNIEIKECCTFEELAACVDLQRKVFALPEIEISPVRHFIVTKNAGGFALGAFKGGDLVGFVLSVPAFIRGERAFYSHMTAVREDFQSFGIGAELKWAQRRRALEEGVKYVKWTFEPLKARNAFFNLEKLGAIVSEYRPNFYGTDYSTVHKQCDRIGLDSDRLFAEWHLESMKVEKLAIGESYVEELTPELTIGIPADWYSLVETNLQGAVSELTRVKDEFEAAFSDGLICRSFTRDVQNPEYLLFKN